MARGSDPLLNLLLIGAVAGGGTYAYYAVAVQPVTGLTFGEWLTTLLYHTQGAITPGGPKPDPDLQVHVTTWQHAQCPNGNPNDWGQFRLWEMAQGFVDPGLYVPAGLGWGYQCP
ncbi:MAG: hypothetical protein ACYC4L_11410 [Chloroflexota bacterium]